jgi:Txe/YoeB family toxin of Txe-Axe toxin-antitoxin module
VFYIIEKQEKLQKDFEDEQVRRVVAEKKLEDLESK